MIIFLRIAITLSLSITSLASQVNTEAMRDNTSIPGPHHNLRASCSYISANSEILFINGNYRLDYNSESNWKYFFIAKRRSQNQIQKLAQVSKPELFLVWSIVYI